MTQSILATALAFFQKNLITPGNPALKSLAELGATNPNHLDRLGLGYANGKLVPACNQDQLEALTQLGLVEDGKDKYTDHLTLALYDQDHQPIGIGIVDGWKLSFIKEVEPFHLFKATPRGETYVTTDIKVGFRLFCQNHQVQYIHDKDHAEYIAEYLNDQGVTRINVVGKHITPWLEPFKGEVYTCKPLQRGKSITTKPTLLRKPQPKLKPSLKAQDGLYEFTFPSRNTYEVKGFKPQQSLNMRLVLTFKRDPVLYVDKVDLYASGARKRLIRALGELVTQPDKDIEAELYMLIAELEAIRKRGNENLRPRVELSPDEQKEAEDILKRPDLLDMIASDIQAMGYVGERENTLLAYLIGTSRKANHTLSGIIRSSSGAGKSRLMNIVSELMPPEDVFYYSRLSPTALYYMQRNELQNKLVIVDERAGSAEADYPIRSLQTAKKLSLAIPMKDQATGRTVTKTFEVLGPIAYMESTTGDVHPENANRAFEIYLDESPEQTAKILDMQRHHRTQQRRNDTQSIIERHYLIQRALKPLSVVIPFARDIAFPCNSVRNRRDNERFLSLVESVAFLHQHQRTIKQGAIQATQSDYKAAQSLAAYTPQQLATELSHGAQTLLGELQKRDVKIFSFGPLRSQLGWNYSRLYRPMQELVKHELVIIQPQKREGVRQYQVVQYQDYGV